MTFSQTKDYNFNKCIFLKISCKDRKAYDPLFIKIHVRSTFGGILNSVPTFSDVQTLYFLLAPYKAVSLGVSGMARSAA